MARTVTMHGIKNCDTIKKARTWLETHDIAYSFRDYKADAPQKSELEAWAKEVGWEVLLNRAGTTFKKLPEKDKENITEKKALALLAAQPSMIKRPLLDVGGKFTVGFKPEIYEKLFPKR